MSIVVSGTGYKVPVTTMVPHKGRLVITVRDGSRPSRMMRIVIAEADVAAVAAKLRKLSLPAPDGGDLKDDTKTEDTLEESLSTWTAEQPAGATSDDAPKG